MKSNSNLTPEEIRELAKRIKLKKIHEDSDVVLVTAPNDDELIEIVKDLLSIKSMSIKEIHQVLSGVASEDKIRRALNTLIEKGEVYIDNNGKYIAVSS
ncbi:MAG: ArsR family transcriptional regulator [Desulfurococcaceae archaeon]|nr:ArsR family transcriptional regulator [Desulfurococcaceae archaeon]